MKQVYRIDEDGIYIEPVVLKDGEAIPADCVEIMPPSFYKAKWVDHEWFEVGEPPVPVDPYISPELKIAALEKDNKMLRLQLNTQSEQYQFLEDVVTEIIIMTQ